MIDALSKVNEKIQDLDKRQQENNEKIARRLGDLKEEAEIAKEDSKHQISVVHSGLSEKIERIGLALSETNKDFSKKLAEAREQNKRTDERISETRDSLEELKKEQNQANENTSQRLEAVEKETRDRIKKKMVKLRHEATKNREEVEKLIEMQGVQEFKERVDRTSKESNEYFGRKLEEMRKALEEKLREEKERSERVLAEKTEVEKIKGSLEEIEARGLEGRLEENKLEGKRQKDKRKVLKKDMEKVREELKQINKETMTKKEGEELVKQLESLKEQISQVNEGLNKSQVAMSQEKENLEISAKVKLERKEEKRAEHHESLKKMKEMHEGLEKEINELIKVGKASEAISNYEHNSDFQAALAIAKQYEPHAVRGLFVNQAKFFMQKGDIQKAENCLIN
jgi:DNA repair exonuclease SbcCD ATPase subunit